MVGTSRGSVLFSLLLIALLLPSVGAYSVEKAWLEWQGHEVKTIAPDKELPDTELKLRLSSDFQECFTSTTGTCALLFQSDFAPANGLRVDIRDACISTPSGANSTTINCSVARFTFSTRNSTILIRYVGQTPTTAIETPLSVSIPIKLDNTSPNVTMITTGYCVEETCYVGSGVETPVTVQFSDSVTAFDYRLVFLSGSASTLAQVKSCVGTTCEGTITIPCSDGQRFQIKLSGPSSEDALNAPTGNSKEVVCIAKAPRITNWTQEADGIAGLAVSGGTFTVRATVEAGTDVVTGEVNASGAMNQSDMLMASCGASATDEDAFDCSWQLSDLAAGTHNLRFTVKDAVGNSVVKEVRLEVLRLESERKADLFTSTVGKPSPERLNRMALELARTNNLPFPLYVPYAVTPKKGTAKVYTQELTGCSYKLANETNYTQTYALFSFGGANAESKVLYPNSNHTQKNRLDLQIRGKPEVLALSDTFQVECTLSMVVGETGTLYTNPENESLRFEVQLRETILGQPGAEFVRKIKEEEDKLKATDQKYLLKLREIRATLDGVCTVMDNLQGLSSTGGSVGAAGTALSSTGWLKIIGDPIAKFGGGVHNSLQKVLDKVWVSKQESVAEISGSMNPIAAAQSEAGIALKRDPGEKWLKTICKQVNCKYATRTEGQEYFDAGAYGGFGGVANDVLENMNTPAPMDSFITSALHVCVGGMIYNAGKWQDINCGYLLCLKEQSLNGQSVAVCGAARDHKQCTYVVNEIFELPGLTRVMSNMAEGINGILQNLPSYVIRGVVVNGACMKYYESHQTGEGPNWPVAACHILKSITDLVEFQQEASQGFTGGGREDAVCLEALCSEEDRAKGDCKTTFNRVEQYTEYSNLLSLNAWLNDKKRTQAQGTQTKATKAYSFLNEKACAKSTSCTITSIEQETRGKDTVDKVTTNVGGITYITYADDTSLSELVGESDIYNQRIFIDALAQGIVLSDEKDVAEYNAYLNAAAFAGDATGKKQVELIDKYNECETETCRTETSGELASQGIIVTGNDFTFLGTECDPGKCVNQVNYGGKTYNSKTLTKEETTDAANVKEKVKYWQTFDFFTNIAVKWAFDQGYLDFLSTSSWGSWGREISQWGDRTLTKEAWSENLCNEMGFDINDNDDGAIYATSPLGGVKPAGSFAVELREWQEGPAAQRYVYLITIFVTNPEQVKPAGISDDDWAEMNTYQMDAKMLGDGEFDLINGTFTLQYRGSFGSTQGPKKAILYLPKKYDRICLTFDKEFPIGGKKTYCRAIHEAVFDRGSPVAVPAPTPGGANTPSGTGQLVGGLA